jgi:D-alanyl-D-alanine dipeptidase
MRLLTDISYAGYSVHPEDVALLNRPRASRPLPPVIDPENLPAVVADAAGSPVPLVPVVHRRIRNLATYWHAGWQTAEPGTWMRADAAELLYAAADALPDRYGFAVFDAWRPAALQREIYDAAYSDPALPAGFVTPPSIDPTTPPPHTTGGTVDLTLTWDGAPLALGTEFDDFTDAAALDTFEGTPTLVRDLRRTLFWAMVDVGFAPYPQEWWHFEYGTRRWAARLGVEPLYPAALPPA